MNASTITVTLNGQPRTLAAHSSLADLLAQQDLTPEGPVTDIATNIATAVNGQFVPRGQRAAHRLQDGDAVLGFQAIVGG